MSVKVCESLIVYAVAVSQMQTLMNVRTRVSVLTNSVRILLDPMSVYPANLDTKHREECVMV